MAPQIDCYSASLNAAFILGGSLEVGVCHEGWYPYPRFAVGMNMWSMGAAANVAHESTAVSGNGTVSDTFSDSWFRSTTIPSVQSAVASHWKYKGGSSNRMPVNVKGEKYELGIFVSAPAAAVYKNDGFISPYTMKIDFGALVWNGAATLLAKAGTNVSSWF